MANSRATRAAQQLDEYWDHLRVKDVDLPVKHLLRMNVSATAVREIATTQATEVAMNLSEAVSLYVRLKGKGRRVPFQRAVERSCGYVIDACGDIFAPWRLR